MNTLKLACICLTTSLFTLLVITGILAFYPSPQRVSFPESPALTFEQDQDQLKQYREDLKNYRAKNKEVEKERKIWTEKVFIINLVAGIILLVGGMFLLNTIDVLGIAVLFTSFILFAFGQTLIVFYSDQRLTSLSLLLDSPTDISIYKEIQFYLVLLATVIASAYVWKKFRNASHPQ